MMRLNLLNTSISVCDSSVHGLIVNDGSASIIDRRGRTVWYPLVNRTFTTGRATVVTDSSIDQLLKVEIKPMIYDMRMTRYGTVTYLTDSAITECDIDGHILWQQYNCDPPSEIGEDNYNHVFMCLDNGHYITLGNQVWRKMPSHPDSICLAKYALRKTFDGEEYGRVEFGTVIEYDKKGNIVWSWNSRDYLDRDGLAPKEGNRELKGHINALSVDRDDRYVYVGFRDISRIVKIDKATGLVADSWGAPVKYGHPPLHGLPIHQQHEATILDDGHIMVFNNNDYPREDSIPSVLIFSQQPSDSGRVIWRYDYDLPHAMRVMSRTGGNADMLPDGHILVCTGTIGEIAELTMDHRQVWHATIRPRDIPGFHYSYRLYRAHYVSSLYPCYFTFATDRDTLSRAAPGCMIRLFNKGSESDAYQITLSSASGILAVLHVATLAAHSTIYIPISLHKHVKGKQVEISIRSDTNPDLQRKHILPIE
jgi:hypothetical protein